MPSRPNRLAEPEPPRPPQTPAAAPAPLLLQRLLAGHFNDPEVTRWLESGFLAWWRCGGAVQLANCLRLPATASACARAVRDGWLCAAAAYLPRESRAAALAAEIERFRTQPRPTVLHQLLALAAASGARLPTSARQVRNILAEADPAFDFRCLRDAASDHLMAPAAELVPFLDDLGEAQQARHWKPNVIEGGQARTQRPKETR